MSCVSLKKGTKLGAFWTLFVTPYAPDSLVALFYPRMWSSEAKDFGQGHEVEMCWSQDFVCNWNSEWYCSCVNVDSFTPHHFKMIKQSLTLGSTLKGNNDFHLKIVSVAHCQFIKYDSISHTTTVLYLCVRLLAVIQLHSLLSESSSKWLFCPGSAVFHEHHYNPPRVLGGSEADHSWALRDIKTHQLTAWETYQGICYDSANNTSTMYLYSIIFSINLLM